MIVFISARVHPGETPSSYVMSMNIKLKFACDAWYYQVSPKEK